MKITQVAGTIALLAVVPGVHAGLTTFGNEGLFKQALVLQQVWIDDLERFDTNEDVGRGGPITLQFSGSTAKSGVLDGQAKLAIDTANGRHSIGAGTQWYWEGGGSSSAGVPTFTVSFGEAVTAFGFYGTDIGDFAAGCGPNDLGSQTCTGLGGQVLKIEVVYGDDTVEELDRNLAQLQGGKINDDEFFLGLTSSAAIKSVRFYNLTGGADGQGFDNFMIGEAAAAPEPSTLALLGLAMVGAAAARRRR